MLILKLKGVMLDMSVWMQTALSVEMSMNVKLQIREVVTSFVKILKEDTRFD